MVLLVLDASVILKWFKEEVYTEIALKIKEEFVAGNHEMVVPDLILYELTNAMRYSRSFNQNLIEESLQNFIDMGIDIVVPTREIFSRSTSLSYLYNISIYDAIYISVAEFIGGKFVTADENLYKKIKELDFVRFIKEFDE